MALLATKNLAKSFGGVHAVDHLNISFEAGKVTALIGPNGSGKTTLVNCLTGMTPFDDGSVVVSGASMTRLQARDVAAYGITRTFQNVRLIPQMSTLDNLLLVLTERNVFGALFERHTSAHLGTAEEMLRKVGLWEKRDEKAENLSYGQRKLLEVARAVLMKSNVYFFDEPFAGLFPEMRKIISDILRELRAGGASVVLIEHDMELVRDLADHCYVLDSGKVIAEGTPEQALKQAHVVEAYLGK